MIEKTVFTNNEIKEQILKNYNLVIKNIEHEKRGSANIFYVYDTNDEKYVFKEFESKCKEEKVLKEAEIIHFLKQKNINVPEYIKTINDKFYFKEKNRIIILMKYIQGYSKAPNTGTYDQTMESAELLGKITRALEGYNRLKEVDIEKWHQKKKVKPEREKLTQMIKILGKSQNELKIKEDFKFKLKLLDKIEKMDFEGMQKMTLKNCHGDYSIMQFIYENEKIKSVLDFERAKYMPISWEIIRSYTHIDEQCKNGQININNLVDYVKIVMKYIKLNEYDLKFMIHMYLLRLATSQYGYEEYLKNNELTDLLNFGFWRTNMCRDLEKNFDEYVDRLAIL